MSLPIEPTSGVNRPQVRLDTGIDVLEEWMDGAARPAKDAVYKALFAMTDRTLLRDYTVVDDDLRLSELFVLLENDLVLKLRIHCFDSFGVVYIGARAHAPGLPRDHGTGLAA
jgi:hypothetical protein